MIIRLLSQIFSAVLGLYLAQKFIEGVIIGVIPGQNVFGLKLDLLWQILLLIGGTIGLINFFVKPILKIIAFPLKLLTFGLFPFVIDALMVWLADILFIQLKINGLIPLLQTTAIIWALNFVLIKFLFNKKILTQNA
ncbi:MAG: phage holin family protein [Candidatus Wildermuthbacteria bacterium]|nr:phage holin family protein [Candidatus Wildermuthbacteria bacterium]